MTRSPCWLKETESVVFFSRMNLLRSDESARIMVLVHDILNQHTYAEEYGTAHSMSCTGQVFHLKIC